MYNHLPGLLVRTKHMFSHAEQAEREAFNIGKYLMSINAFKKLSDEQWDDETSLFGFFF